jgi:ComF family protein
MHSRRGFLAVAPRRRTGRNPAIGDLILPRKAINPSSLSPGRGLARSLAVGGRAAGAAVRDLLLPCPCGGCGAAVPAAEGLCEACERALLERVALPYCPRCANTLGPNVPARPDGCADCPTPLPPWRSIVRLGPYGGPLKRCIHSLKFHRDTSLLVRLGGMLAEACRRDIEDEGDGIDLVQAVPSHWLRRLARGSDPAGQIAAALARRLKRPRGDELMRIRNTPPQVHLSRLARQQNVLGAFAARKGHDLDGAAVLLVDDVTTTGATLCEAAKTCLRCGARTVRAAVVAKAERPRAYLRET